MHQPDASGPVLFFVNRPAAAPAQTFFCNYYKQKGQTEVHFQDENPFLWSKRYSSALTSPKSKVFIPAFAMYTYT